MQEALSATLTAPGGHTAQDVEPVEPAKVPALQAAQEADPDTAVNMPSGHNTQEIAPVLGEYVPGAH